MALNFMYKEEQYSILQKQQKISILLLFVFLVSLSGGELSTWRALSSGADIIVVGKSCKRMGEHVQDTGIPVINNTAETDNDFNQVIVTRFCSFVTFQLQPQYSPLLIPSLLYFSDFSTDWEYVYIGELGMPPRA
jgi:hypothetical protein